MACPEFSPDFYNNVAAVAVVLMFAKVVTHRSRKAHHGPEWTSILAGFHIVAVLAAIVTVVVCLKATDSGSDTDHVWRTRSQPSAYVSETVKSSNRGSDSAVKATVRIDITLFRRRTESNRSRRPHGQRTPLLS